MTQTTEPKAVWWAVSEEAILEMLNRVALGEQPDMVYAEFYVNSDIERIDP